LFLKVIRPEGGEEPERLFDFGGGSSDLKEEKSLKGSSTLVEGHQRMKVGFATLHLFEV
jgi:hypothetical protein